MRWKVPFGAFALGVGVFALYAAWANPPFRPATLTLCADVNSPGVHFTDQWTLQYYNSCGGNYDHQLLYLLGFTGIGVTLIGGSLATIREAIQ